MNIDGFLLRFYKILDDDIAATTELITNTKFEDLAQFERIRGRLNGIKLAKHWIQNLYKEITEPEKKDDSGNSKY